MPDIFRIIEKWGQDLLNLNAPWFSWLAAIFLIIWPVYEIIRLFLISNRQSRTLEKISITLNDIRRQSPVRGNEGLSIGTFDKVEQEFHKNPRLYSPWVSFKSSLIFRRSRQRDTDEVWAVESPAMFFREETILESHFNKKFFMSIPGIVTGLGLLFTFIAILVALKDVRIESNKVVGLEQLIQGLSGKFVSSVTALSTATVFLIVEKVIFHRLNIRRLNLISSIDELFPRLSPAQIMVDTEKNIAEQTDAFKIFNADLANKLKNSFSESLGPTLQNMVNVIDELNKTVSLSAQSKDDSIVSHLEGLLKNIEESIVSSLQRMSEAFNQTLTGSTRDQFNKVAEIIGTTSVLLENMNKQFVDSQVAINSLIGLAEKSTAEQISIGKSQTEELTYKISELMNKLSDSMSSSLRVMEGSLLALSEKLTKTIEDTSIESAKVATEIINEASGLSANNLEHLRKLLEKHESELNRVEELDRTLNNTLVNFNSSVKFHGQIADDLKYVSAEVKNVITKMSQISSVMKEGQDTVNKTTAFAQTQLSSLSTANAQQKEVWERIHKSMKEYESTFARVEANAKVLLADVSMQLENYHNVVHKNFESILANSDELLSNAVGRISGSIEELQELLEELNESITTFVNSNRSRA